MLEHIIKSLAPKDIASILIVLGLVREARQVYKITLDYKIKKIELRDKK